MLIYIGTPLAAVGLWKREDVDRTEASLYRRIMRIGNDVPNVVILNTMTNIRLAGEVIHYLSREAWSEFRRQNRVTKYFDQIEGREASNDAGDSGNTDAAMENPGGGRQNTESIDTSSNPRQRQQPSRTGGGGGNGRQKYDRPK